MPYTFTAITLFIFAVAFVTYKEFSDLKQSLETFNFTMRHPYNKMLRSYVRKDLITNTLTCIIWTMFVMTMFVNTIKSLASLQF